METKNIIKRAKETIAAAKLTDGQFNKQLNNLGKAAYTAIVQSPIFKKAAEAIPGTKIKYSKREGIMLSAEKVYFQVMVSVTGGDK